MSKTDNEFRPFIEDVRGEPEAGYDEWFREQVQKTLDDVKTGKATLHPLDDVLDELGW